MKTNQIIKIFGTEYKQMTKDILFASHLAEMIPDKSSRICIKPNLVVSKPAECGATTHPEIVAGIIEYLRTEGFENITIAEGCWLGEEMADCFEKTGFSDLCREYGIPFIDINTLTSHIVDCGGMDLLVSDIVNDFDFLINVPVLKGHCQVKMTCAIKNIKGFVPNSEKRRFHALGITEPLGHLPAGIHQDFIVVDNICGDLDFEEGGNPFVRNCIMTAVDPVLVDSYVREMFRLLPEEVPYLQIAESLGVGSSDTSNADIISIGETSYDVELPRSSKVLDVEYAAEALDACSACYASLIPALMKLREEGLLGKLRDRIAIGQAHRNKTGKLGIGKCTSQYETCIMGCPPDREKIYNELKNYILNNNLEENE